jgi:hypothetical protein
MTGEASSLLERPLGAQKQRRLVALSVFGVALLAVAGICVVASGIAGGGTPSALVAVDREGNIVRTANNLFPFPPRFAPHSKEHGKEVLVGKFPASVVKQMDTTADPCDDFYQVRTLPASPFLLSPDGVPLDIFFLSPSPSPSLPLSLSLFLCFSLFLVPPPLNSPGVLHPFLLCSVPASCILCCSALLGTFRIADCGWLLTGRAAFPSYCSLLAGALRRTR